MTMGLDALWPALLVGLGGSLGALSRFGVDTLVGGTRGVVVVNVLGSVALGALVAGGVGSDTFQIFGTGFCGAFTTFSSFAVGVAERASDGKELRAAGYAVGMLVVALAGVGLGGLMISLT